MSLRRTPLYDRHAERGATFTDFGGWDMPVEFESIRTEHRAVREDVGVFDVSHMTEIGITGADARALLQRLTTGDVDRLHPGEAQYTLLPDEEGTIIDDAILYRLADTRYLLVANAGKDEALAEHCRTYRRGSAGVENETAAWGMLAIQGPDADESLPASVAGIDRLGIERVEIAGIACWGARTGYTGEEGVELLVPWEHTAAVDGAIAGERCGLGARDTLRLEMGYVLAGHEFDREGNRRGPYEASLDFAVALGTDPPCLGHDALVEQEQRGSDELLVGLVMDERGIPRAGYAILATDGGRIGTVTSGTMSPTREQGIALGYVDAEYAEPGRQVGVEIREATRRASIEEPPFVGAG